MDGVDTNALTKEIAAICTRAFISHRRPLRGGLGWRHRPAAVTIGALLLLNHKMPKALMDEEAAASRRQR